MKKIVLSIAASMLICLCAVQAQQQKTDTTGTAKSKTQQQNRQKNEQSRQQRDQSQQQRGQPRQQQSGRYQNHDAYGNEGMVVIEKDKIPSSLKQTLQDKKYVGWENATIYHNSNTGEYVIVQKAYMFDKQGKEIEMKNSAAYGNREGRQGRYSGDQDQYPSRDQSQNDQSQKDEAQSDNQSSQTPQSNSNQNDQAQQDDSQQQSDNGQQQPSSSYRTDRNTQDNSNAQSQQGQSGQEQYRTEGMVEVQAEQIPASLRRTLSESQYRGWEDSGKVYQDPSTKEYVLVIEQTSNTSQPRSYRFDKNGQMKDDQSGTSKNKQ